MKLNLGKFEISVENGKVLISIKSTPGHNALGQEIELDRFAAIKLRNWLNDYINNS